MISVPAGVRIYLALEPCDMRKGFDGLALMVQQSLGKDPFLDTCSYSGAREMTG